MIRLNINGQWHEAAEDGKLLDYLRDELGLTGTKDGCGAGACGACTVIIDGKKTKSCIFKLSQLEGKHIVTIEGLTDRERDVYAYAFGECGAVQCGFCIPGMVISAKALIDENPNPTRDDVKLAINGNICRCTGYVKIEDAILLAAKLFRENAPIPESDRSGKIGSLLHRVDAVEKTLGTGVYTDDMVLPNMIYAKAVRSKYPRARVNKIDISKAKAHPDCVEVLVASDVPFNKTGHIIPDWDVLIAEGDCTRYVGDAVALVATKHKKYLDEVCNLVEVDYTELTPITTPEEGLAEGAPKLHPKGNVLAHEVLNRGNADEAIAKAKYVVTRHYSTPQTDHAFMEPECAIADWRDGQMYLYTGSQSVYDEQHEVSRMLGLKPSDVHVHSNLVGGGFGGKEDMSVQHHAALMSWKTGLPVKVKFSRQESLDIHVKRHAMEMDITTACDEEGNLVASKVIIVSDCGAYASLGGPVLQRACTHSGGPYHYDNFYVEGTCVYTNNVPGGAFRGFGVTQSCFGQEVNIDLLADMVGMDPWEFRYKNAIRPGESLPNGQLAGPETGLVECLEAVKDAYYSNPGKAGLAICMKNSGIGVGLPDIGRVRLEVRDGKVRIRTSAACIGQGIGTVATQILCETAGISADDVIVEAPDTDRTPDSGTTTASRQTVFTGEAVRKAALELKGTMLDGGLAAVEGREFYAEYHGVTDKMGSPKPHPVSHVAYGYGACVAVVDEKKLVSDLHVAFDVGRVINPKACEGQVEGGALMGMGYGVSEDFTMDKGRVLSKYGTLGLLRAKQRPQIHVHLIEKGVPEQMAYGAKGIGEISSIPMAPSISNAYRRVDGEERRSLPLRHTGYKK